MDIGGPIQHQQQLFRDTVVVDDDDDDEEKEKNERPTISLNQPEQGAPGTAAAAVASVQSSTIALPKEEPNEADAVDGEPECVICLTRPKRVCLGPCGHKCLCVTCTRDYLTKRNEATGSVLCPVCRDPVVSATKVYE